MEQSQYRRLGEIQTGRRGFLRGIAVGVAGAAAVAVGLEGIRLAIESSKTHFEASEVYVGKAEVLKGVHVRTSPTIPSSANEPPNIVGWDKIRKINGVDIRGLRGFNVENPKIYRGFDPNGRAMDSAWIELEVEVGNMFTGSTKKRAYISMSTLTADYVKFDPTRPFVSLKKDTQGQPIAKTDGKSITAEQMGIVTPLTSEVLGK